jgi:Protein of unknown function (DUF2949)
MGILTQRKPAKVVNDPHFIEYLQQELGVSETEIALAKREQQPSVNLETKCRP